ncbi:MAG: LVIVD repeat-containing protein [Actinomycetota bacterium]
MGAQALVRILVTALSAMVFAVGMPAQAGHDEDLHSDNFQQLVRRPISIGDDLEGRGSDLAFDGKRVYAGSYEGTALYQIMGRRDGYLKQIGFHNCPGSQGDVSFSGKHVFVSVDAPASNNVENGVCNNTKTNLSDTSLGKEGIRIVDYSDPKQPKQVGFIEMQCGSHTHTLVPDGEWTYMYIESYPISQSATCNAAAGHGQVGIIKFPTNDPTKAELIEPFDVTPTPLPNDAPIGCHDLQAWPARDIVIAACITESQVWDISDPAKPEILARITNPEVQIWHSAAFTWDGKYAIISDEYGGAAGGGGCAGDKDSTIGAMWFYNIEDPSNPVLEGHYSLPRVPVWDDEQEAQRSRCTTHLYTILPMRDPDKYIAVSSYYSGGISAVDFSDPANPEEIGFYLHQPKGILPDTWATYWYNGRIYTNDHLSGHGVGVYKMQGLNHKKVWYYDGGLNPQTQIAAFK